MSAAKKLIEDLKADVKSFRRRVGATYISLVRVFPLQPIRSKSQHDLALIVIEKLIAYSSSKKHPDDGVDLYLKTLVELVSDYEKTHVERPKVNGAEMLAYLMELQGLSQSDLSSELGGQSIVSQVLKGKRELNLRQIKALAKRFKVSPEVFIK